MNWERSMTYARLEGIEEGRAAGLEEGRVAGILQTARSLLAMKIEAETVAKGTGLSLDKVLEIQKELQEEN